MELKTLWLLIAVNVTTSFSEPSLGIGTAIATYANGDDCVRAIFVWRKKEEKRRKILREENDGELDEKDKDYYTCLQTTNRALNYIR